MEITEFFDALDLDDYLEEHGDLAVQSPLDGVEIARVSSHSNAAADEIMGKAETAFLAWRQVPAPKRGELVRLFGEELRKAKEPLGRLVTVECGKILQEGLGEVQEMIDICDFAVGLSRQLYGKSMHSERPEHRMYEQWHPLGPVGVVTAFNFPVAVWSWNAAIAAVCGDSMIWKPSSETPLTAIAVTKIAQRVLEANDAPPIFGLVVADRRVGRLMTADKRLPLISATGSVRMGKAIGQAVAERVGRSLLELGGNNGIVVSDSADLDQALRAVLFAAFGTAGQRCTTARRLFLHKSIAAEMKQKLVKATKSITIGDPAEEGVLMGPLINQRAVDDMMNALATIREQGGEILCGGEALDRPGFFVQPTIATATADMPITCEETFAPILYVFEYEDLDEAIAMHNGVPQGLSSAIFTLNLREAERFLAATGSDCGIANVNIATSGAEIGGAFGGEKETGGGRESGSDSWKIYMRRQTCTINWGTEMPLAQGVHFDVGE